MCIIGQQVHCTQGLCVGNRSLTVRAAANEYFSTRVLVNTWSTLIQAANDEERVVSRRNWGPKDQGLEQTSPLHVYIQINFQVGKLQMKSRSPKFP